MRLRTLHEKFNMIDFSDRRLKSISAFLFFLIGITPYFVFTFFNVDPLHDGWFSSPATAMAQGGVPYRDVVTSYGWFTPALLAAIIKIFGFQLLYFRLVGLILFLSICVLSVLLIRKSLGLNRALVVVSVWLLIGLGNLTKDPQALPAWGLWPNQFIIFGTLLLIYFLLRPNSLSYLTLTTIGLIAGLTPWIRAQGILIFASALFVFSVRIYQSSDFDKPRKILHLFSVSFLIFSAPFLYLQLNDALDEWFWQTIEMPRSGEWVGMPDPAVWMLQNFGLAIILTLGLFFVSFVLGLLKISSKKATLLMAPVLVLVSVFPISQASLDESVVMRKVHSIFFLYSNYHFFTLPVLIILTATLFLVFRILRMSLISRGSNLFEMPTLVAILGIPPLTLVYYNFGHLWGVSPLLFLSVLYFWKQNREFASRFSRFRQVVVLYSILVSLLAVPQIYSNLAKPAFTYSASGLVGMKGQDPQQVLGVQKAIQSLSRLPNRSLVFFLCENAFYSTFQGRYLSDNSFYSSSMTIFDLRSPENRSPSPETKFVVYCPGSNTIPIEQLPGNWALLDFKGNLSSAGLQIYERK
jgi:hypothetical protein